MLNLQTWTLGRLLTKNSDPDLLCFSVMRPKTNYLIANGLSLTHM